MLIGLASQASAAACLVRSWASANAFLAASPRFSIAALRSFGIADLHRLDQRGQRRFGVGGHGHVHRLEALEVLVIRLGQQLDGVDADQLGVGLDPGAVDADAVLAVVGIGVHDGPEVGKLDTQDDVSIADRRGRTAEIVGLGEVHAAALIDDPRLQELGQLDQKPHAVLGARRTIGDDHRILRIGEQPRRFFHARQYRPAAASSPCNAGCRASRRCPSSAPAAGRHRARSPPVRRGASSRSCRRARTTGRSAAGRPACRPTW